MEQIFELMRACKELKLITHMRTHIKDLERKNAVKILSALSNVH